MGEIKNSEDEPFAPDYDIGLFEDVREGIRNVLNSCATDDKGGVTFVLDLTINVAAETSVMLDISEEKFLQAAKRAFAYYRRRFN